MPGSRAPCTASHHDTMKIEDAPAHLQMTFKGPFQPKPEHTAESTWWGIAPLISGDEDHCEFLIPSLLLFSVLWVLLRDLLRNLLSNISHAGHTPPQGSKP